MRVARFAGRPAFLPTATQELLLHAAVGPGDGALAAWQEWKARVGGLDNHDAPSYNLLPLVYRRLSADGADDGDLRRLKGIYRHTWYCSQRILHDGARALHLLDAAGIRTLLPEGAVLIERYYRDPGVRQLASMDVQVPTHETESAFALLSKHGWSGPDHVQFARLRGSIHATALVGSRGQQVALHWSALAVLVDDTALWAAAVPITIDGVATLALRPEHQLLQILVDGTDELGTPLQWVADAITVLADSGDTFDWRCLTEAALGLGLARRLVVPLRYLQAAFEVPVPASSLAQLTTAPTSISDRLARWALANKPRHGASFLHAWARWRRIPLLGRPGLPPANFGQYLAWHWGVEGRADVARHLAAKVLRIARSGRRPAPPDGGRSNPRARH